MGMTPGQQQAEREPGERAPRPARGALTGATYAALLVLGVMEGLTGSFLYSEGPAPLAALGFCVAILATCLFAGWGMRSMGAALVPAVGWIIASFVLSMPDSGGSVIITNTTAGKWYLYGGAFSAAIGVSASFVLWARTQHRTR
ncbi:MAG: hypothetical protein JOY82_03160 [Streptosporangiaceae bacterium]|nr:hypothetical protein [Streptosporangiaceae bacterium]